MVLARNCGVCTFCCDGFLEGVAYGNIFKKDHPCIYLNNKKCSIYPYRPESCQNYYCAWRQGIFSDNLYPPSAGFIVSVENLREKQFLKIIYVTDTINNVNIEEVENFCRNNNTHFVEVKL